ncbi:MAG: hypothetical protein ACTHMW_02995, partial [Actinomycetes bacterium]
GPGDGLVWMSLLGVAGGVLALAVGLARVRRLSVASSEIGAAARQEPRPALALLSAAPDGGPVLLVCDPVVQPVQLYAVPVTAPLPQGAAAAFPSDSGRDVLIRGVLGDGAAVVVDVPGIAGSLWPAAPAWHPDGEELLLVLDPAAVLGHAVGEDEETWAARGFAD